MRVQIAFAFTAVKIIKKALLRRYMTGLAIALVAVTCVLIAIIGVVVYRVTMRSVVYKWRQNKEFSLIDDDTASKV